MPKDNPKIHFPLVAIFAVFGFCIISCSEKDSFGQSALQEKGIIAAETSTIQNKLFEWTFEKLVEAQSGTTKSPGEIKKTPGDIGSVKTTSNNDTLIDKQLLFQTLTGWREAQEAYIIQKEIAAWSAATIYVAGLLAIAGFILDKSKHISVSLGSVLFGSVFLVFFSFIVFIHSHYSSLYEQTAVRAAITRCTSKLISNKNWAPDLTIKENDVYPTFLIKERNELRTQVCHFAQSRFFEILKRLWTGRRGELNPQEKQEAAIYSILTVTTLCFLLITFTRLDVAFRNRVFVIISRYSKKITILILSFLRKTLQLTVRSVRRM